MNPLAWGATGGMAEPPSQPDPAGNPFLSRPFPMARGLHTSAGTSSGRAGGDAAAASA